MLFIASHLSLSLSLSLFLSISPFLPPFPPSPLSSLPSPLFPLPLFSPLSLPPHSHLCSLPLFSFSTEPPTPSIISDPPTLCDFMEHVAYHVQAKWYDLGLMLHVQSDTLDGYKDRCRGDQLACLERVFEEWRKKTDTELFHWSSIVTALQSNLVSKNILANRVVGKF